jgi:hypothetical protein
LEPEAQDDLIPWADRGDFDLVSPADLAREVASRTHLLHRVPWKLEDLDPQAGPCSACPLRSSHHPSLFDEIEPADAESAGRKPKKTPPSDRCLNPSCWSRKLAVHVDRRASRLAEEHPDLLRLSDHPTRPDEISSYRVSEVKKGTSGAVPALHSSGPKAGSLTWVVPHAPRHSLRHASTEQPSTPRKLTLDEKRERKLKQRQLRAIELLREAATSQPSSPPALSRILCLAVVFGTHQKNDHGSYTFDTGLADLGGISTTISGLALWDLSDELAAYPETDLTAHLWHRVLPVLLQRLTNGGSAEDVARAFEEAGRLASLLGLDAEAFLAKAIEALPDPKAWLAEERAQTATTPQTPDVQEAAA